METIERGADAVTNWLFGKYINKSATYIKRYGDQKIVTIEVKRTPIEKSINILLDVVTLGKFTPAKHKASYEDLFHLYSVITLDSGMKLLLEKNQNINIEVSPKDRAKTESTAVIPLKEPLTFKEMLEKTNKKIGDNRFFKYDAFSNNCQAFVSDVLAANGLLTAELTKFILQPVDVLIKNLPQYTRYVSRLTTTGAAYLEKMFTWFRRYKNGGIAGSDPSMANESDAEMLKTLKIASVSKRRTRDYRKYGGLVVAENPTAIELTNTDTIPSLLVVSELVIPKKYSKLVQRFLRSQNILLPGMAR